MNMKQAGIITRLWDLMMTRRDIIFPSWEAGFVYSMKRKAIRHGWDLTLKQELKLEELAMTYLGSETLNAVYEADLEAVERRVAEHLIDFPNSGFDPSPPGRGIVGSQRGLTLREQVQILQQRASRMEEQVKYLEDKIGPPPSVVTVQLDDCYRQINDVRLQIEAMVEHFDAWDKLIQNFGRESGYEKDVKKMVSEVTHLTEHDMTIASFEVFIVGRLITITYAGEVATYFDARNQTHIIKRIRNWATVHYLVRFEQARVA